MFENVVIYFKLNLGFSIFIYIIQYLSLYMYSRPGNPIDIRPEDSRNLLKRRISKGSHKNAFLHIEKPLFILVKHINNAYILIYNY